MIPENSSSDNQNEELHSLLDALCNGTLTDSSHARLQAILKTSEEARREYLAFIDLHFDLRQIHSRIGDLPANSDKLLVLLQSDSSRLGQTFDEFDGTTEATRPAVLKRDAMTRRFQRFAIAATILLALGAGLSVWARWGRSGSLPELKSNVDEPSMAAKTGNQPLAATPEVILVQAASAKLFGEPTPAINSRMDVQREYALSEGMFELRFPSGATTIIEAPALFEIASASRLLVKTGKCSVYAPEGAQGFRVDTPLGNVVDLGTRFTVNVQQSGEMEVQVVEGEAELFPNAANGEQATPTKQKIKLLSGQANRVTQGPNIIAKEIAFSADEYQRGLPDRLVSFEAVEDADGAVDDLISVTVQRGGQRLSYKPNEMIGIDVIHFTSGNNACMVTPARVEDPARPTDLSVPRTHYLDRDFSLCSGLINPGGQSTPLSSDPVLHSPSADPASITPGLGFRFREPLLNSVGPDLVIFELQTIVNSEHGDAFHLSPLRFSEGLQSITVNQYDIDLVSPESRFLSPYRLYRFPKNATDLEWLLSTEHTYAPVHTIRAKVLAVAVDLSDMGFSIGDSATGLFLQDAHDDADYIDPIFVGGLPPIP